MASTLGAALLLLTTPPINSPAMAADPASGTVAEGADFAWQGATYAAAASTVLPCPSAEQDPDNLICDHVTVDVSGDGGLPLVVSIQSDVESSDFDLYLYDSQGDLVGSSGSAGSAESVTVPGAAGSYEVRVQPWLVTEPSTYTGAATLAEQAVATPPKGGDRPPKTKKYAAPDFSENMWGLEEIGATLANETTTGEDAVVAVIDTGVDVHHPEFERRFTAPMSWVCPEGVPVPCAGYDYVDDGHGHGTHVAGTVAAADDGKGVTGVAPDATIMPIRVGDDEGSIVGDLAAATRYATEQGADVITVSIGFIAGSGPVISNPVVPLDDGWAEAVQEAADAGILVTLAAGNDGVPYCGQGELWQDAAACVGAYGTDDDPAAYSDWDAAIDLSAPGGGLLSCEGGIWSTVPLDLAEVDSCTATPGYAVYSGTSMATPHVAGVGALLADLGVGGLDARQRLIDTARGAGVPTGPASITGPRLDAAGAVQP
ncbi:MAG: S8 family serine peptidase [Nocardioides sp.]